jgi:hypothetical protein
VKPNHASRVTHRRAIAEFVSARLAEPLQNRSAMVVKLILAGVVTKLLIGTMLVIAARRRRRVASRHERCEVAGR